MEQKLKGRRIAALATDGCEKVERHLIPRREPNERTHGAERGFSRFEGSSDAVFAIALTLLIVEIKCRDLPKARMGTTTWRASLRSSGANTSR